MFKLTAFGKDQILVLKGKARRHPDNIFYKEMLELLEDIRDKGFPSDVDWGTISILVKRGLIEVTE